MIEIVPGNGKLPEGQADPAARGDTRQLDQALKNFDRLMAERNSAGGQTQTTTALSLRPVTPSKQPGSEQVGSGSSGAGQAPSGEADTLLDDPSLQLLMRFLVGSAIVGVEELLSRVRRWDEQEPEDPLAAGGKALEEATNLDLARYLIVGSLIWGRRQMVRAVRTNLIGSRGKPPTLLLSLDRLTARWPLSSLREPFRQAAASFSATAEQRIQEGWREEQLARWLASHAIGEIIDDFIDHISENPQLAELVREQINRQSLGLATTVRDTGREWSTTGDDLVESIVRRLLRRRPRSELEGSSPAAGPTAEDARGQ